MELTKEIFEFLISDPSNAEKFAKENMGSPSWWITPKSGKVIQEGGKTVIVFNNYPKADVFEFDYERKEFFGVPFEKVLQLFDELENSKEIYACDIDVDAIMESLNIKWVKPIPPVTIEILIYEYDEDDEDYKPIQEKYDREVEEYWKSGKYRTEEEPPHPSWVKSFSISSWRYND